MLNNSSDFLGEPYRGLVDSAGQFAITVAYFQCESCQEEAMASHVVLGKTLYRIGQSFKNAFRSSGFLNGVYHVFLNIVLQPVQNFQREVIFAFEVIVKGPFADRGGFQDVVGAGVVVAVQGEQVHGGIQDVFPGFFSALLGCHYARVIPKESTVKLGAEAADGTVVCRGTFVKRGVKAAS